MRGCVGRTRDAAGTFLYVRDVATGRAWSAGHQPLCVPADSYEVIFSRRQGRVPPPRRGRSRRCSKSPSRPDRDAEVRRLTLVNHDTVRAHAGGDELRRGRAQRPAADLAHPAFGKLFLETEWLPAVGRAARAGGGPRAAGPAAGVRGPRGRRPTRPGRRRPSTRPTGRSSSAAGRRRPTRRRSRTPALGDRRRRCSTRCSPCAERSGSRRAERDAGVHHRRARTRGRPPSALADHLPRARRRRPGVRPGVGAQPGRTAPTWG